MKQKLTLLFILFSIISNAQITEYLRFNINFDLSISKKYCFDRDELEQKGTIEFETEFFLMTKNTRIMKIELTKDSSENYNLNGAFISLAVPPTFYTPLIIMVKPKFENNISCENYIRTYLIDLKNVDVVRSKGKSGYSLSIDLGTIKLGKKHFITIQGKRNNIEKNYSYFQGKLTFSIDEWYKLALNYN